MRCRLGRFGANTGLTDTLSGDPVTLKQVGTTEVDGVVTVGGQTFTVFTYVVNSSGDVTFTLERSVSDNGSSTTLQPNSVTLSQTITDGDGTTNSNSLDISTQFSITDDTPVIALTGAALSTLTVHEADLQSGTNGGINGTIADGATSSGPISFAGAFHDNFGADGAAKTGSVTYALLVGNNSTTNLIDTQSGTAVTLSTNGATEIDGKDANGDLVFKITVDGRAT